MKKVKLLAIGIIVACTLQAQNTMSYKNLEVDFEQLTTNLNGTGQIIDSAQKYQGVAGSKLDFINLIDALNPNLSTDNYEQAKRMLLTSSVNVEKEMFSRLTIQYYIDNDLWNPSGFQGQTVTGKCINGSWFTGEYVGQLNGYAIIKQRDDVYRPCELKTILPE